MKTHLSILLFGLALISMLLGCAKGKSQVTRSGEAKPLAAVVAEEPLAAALPIGIYYLGSEDGAVWRSRLDGSMKELVAKTKADRLLVRKGIPQFVEGDNWTPGKKPNRLYLYGAPTRNGFLILDQRRAPQLERTGHYPNSLSPREVVPAMPFIDTGKPSDWSATFLMNGHELEPHHVHYGWVGLTMRKGIVSRTLRLDSDSDQSQFLGLFSSGHILLLDNPNLILWNLQTDRKWVIGNALSAVLWPRDLSDPERFGTIACVQSGGWIHKWKLKNPSDLKPKDEDRVGSSQGVRTMSGMVYDFDSYEPAEMKHEFMGRVVQQPQGKLYQKVR